MTTVLDLSPLAKRKFEFSHNGEKVEWEFSALTAAQVEEIRSSVPIPKPPLKRVEGKSGEELAVLKNQGHRIRMEDFDDPDYQKALKQYDDDVSMEMVRAALGWNMGRAEFAEAMQSRVPYGVLANLISAVNAATFSVDQGLIGNLSGRSSP